MRLREKTKHVKNDTQESFRPETDTDGSDVSRIRYRRGKGTGLILYITETFAIGFGNLVVLHLKKEKKSVVLLVNNDLQINIYFKKTFKDGKISETTLI